MNYYHNDCGFNVATLNCRSLRSELKKKTVVADDLVKYRISACAVQETHTTETCLDYITTLDNKHNYDLFNCGNNLHHGVGILILSDLQASFKVISERICSAEFNVYQTEKTWARN